MKTKLHAQYYNYIGEFIGEEDIPFIPVEVYPKEDTGFIMTSPHFQKLPVWTTVILTHKDLKEYFTVTRVIGSGKYTLKHWMMANFNVEFFNEYLYINQIGDLQQETNLITEPHSIDVWPIASCTFDSQLGERVGSATIANFKFATHPFNLKFSGDDSVLGNTYDEDSWKKYNLNLKKGTDTQTHPNGKELVILDENNNEVALLGKSYYKVMEFNSQDAIFNIHDALPESTFDDERRICYIMSHEVIDDRLHMTCNILEVALSIPIAEIGEEVIYSSFPIDNEVIDLSNEIYFDIVTPEAGDIKSFEIVWGNYEEEIFNTGYYSEEITYRPNLGLGEETTEILHKKPDEDDADKSTPNFLYENGIKGEMNKNDRDLLSLKDLANYAWLTPDTYLKKGIVAPIRGLPVKETLSNGRNTNDPKFVFEKSNEIGDKKYTFEFSVPNKHKSILLKNLEVGMQMKIEYPGFPQIEARLTGYIYNEYYTRYIFGSETSDILRIIQRKGV